MRLAASYRTSSRELPRARSIGGTRSSAIRSWSAIRSASWPTTSRWSRAPARSTPRPATARKTTSVGRQYGIATYCPVDAAGRFFHAEGAAGRLPEETDRQDGVGSQSDRDRDPASSTARCSARRRSRTPTRTAGAATSRRSSAPPSSGSSAWSATISASDALEAITQVQVDAGVGRGAHLQHDRHAARLVHLAPARLGRADHRVLLRELPRAADRPQDSRRRRGAVRASIRPTSGTSARPPNCCPPGTSAPSAAARNSARRPTFSTSGSIPDRAIWPCSTNASACPGPPTSIWKAATSIAAGSTVRCWWASGCKGARRTASARSTAGRSTAKAGRCTSRSATPSSRKRSSRITARRSCGCGRPRWISTKTCASRRRS